MGADPRSGAGVGAGAGMGAGVGVGMGAGVGVKAGVGCYLCMSPLGCWPEPGTGDGCISNCTSSGK